MSASTAAIADDADARLQETDFIPPEEASSGPNGTHKSTVSGNPDETRNGLPEVGHRNGYGSTPNPPSKPVVSARVLAPDLLRGLIMVFQSLDHASISMGAWQHGIALETEADGQVVDEWNSPSAWTIRMLTHLCAPGFMFLLGMGVVYFGKSRTNLGWSARSMANHFAIRCLVLIIVNEVLGLVLGKGRVLFLNIVLVALAVNYLLAGLLWILLNVTESRLAGLLSSLHFLKDDEASQPLLERTSESHVDNKSRSTARARLLSWHIHNVVLIILAAVTIWWNIWLSPTHAHCLPGDLKAPRQPDGSVTRLGFFFDFWFYPIQNRFAMSGFPPLAWLSFAILGLVYGRVVTARKWSASALSGANAAAGAGFAALFVATRLLHWGNLSEGCLRMPEQHGGNQYLASFKAFFYITKYPPSPSFLFYSMSFNFLWLSLFGALPVQYARRIPALLTFGTSALFFYAAHLTLYSIFAEIFVPLIGHDLGYTDPRTQKPAVGLGNTWQWWLIWAVGLALLLPLCHWYGRFKSRKGPNSLWRFF